MDVGLGMDSYTLRTIVLAHQDLGMILDSKSGNFPVLGDWIILWKAVHKKDISTQIN